MFFLEGEEGEQSNHSEVQTFEDIVGGSPVYGRPAVLLHGMEPWFEAVISHLGLTECCIFHDAEKHLRKNT